MGSKKKSVIKAIKGFDSNLKCRGFQYEIGKTYKLPKGEKVSICNNGFHAIDSDECPLNVFEFYPPCGDKGISRYCNVDVSGDTQKKETKIVGSEIKINTEIGIAGLVKAHIDWVKRHLIDDDEHKSVNDKDCSSASNTGYYSSASNTGSCSSASNTGYYSSASNTGYCSSASNTGNCSSASNTGNCSSASNTGSCSSASNTGSCSSASNTGNCSSASNTGYCSSASNTGNCSSASNTGDYSSASNTGYQSSASNTGDYSSASNTGNRSSASNTGYQSSASNTGNQSSAEVSGKDSCAAVFGKGCKARGSIGCALFLTERGDWNGETYPILNVKAVIVDGKKIKADTWYKLVKGKLVECD